MSIPQRSTQGLGTGRPRNKEFQMIVKKPIYTIILAAIGPSHAQKPDPSLSIRTDSVVALTGFGGTPTFAERV